MRSKKRILSLAMALLALLGCLAGCGETEEILTAETTQPGKALGRYAERAVALPQSVWPLDMVTLSAGQLRVAIQEEDGTVLICTAAADTDAWDTLSLPSDILDSGSVESVALSPDGTVFCDTLQKREDGTYQPHFWVLEPSGESREIPVAYADVDPQTGYFIPHCDFTDDGRLLAQFYLREVREVDLETGALGGNLNELETVLFKSCCDGADVYMLSMDSGSVCRDGVTEALSGVLGEQLLASLHATEGNTPKLTFWKNADGYLFFTTHAGLYSYIPGGGVTEELVSGARTSLGDPTFLPTALTGAADGSFYVLGSQAGETVLYHYVFDAEAPIAADNQLRVYSLYDDEDLRQMIAQFQTAHPETSVDLEIGITGEDGVTEADAIRTLNTRILAGDGPDLLRLDGLSIDAYLEKELLLELNDVLAQGGPLLEQVTGCYAQDGRVCAVPTTFAIPAIYGPGHIVSQIHDLDSLVAAATQAQEENTLAETVLMGILPVLLADSFYDSCSAAWRNPDGTLDQGKLTEFYAGMQALYALDAPYRQENAQMLAAWTAESGSDYIPGDYTGLSGSISVCMGNTYLTAGTLEGMRPWARVLAGDDLLEEFETAPLCGQAGNSFLPRRVMGILTTSAHPEAAKQFLAFLLSDEVQAKDLSTGFPVNRTVFEREIAEDRTVDLVFGTSDGDGKELHLEAQYPDARRRQELKTWVDNLTTPALTDRIIRGMVMDQMDDCLNGKITPQQAAEAALRSVNLYLSE